MPAACRFQPVIHLHTLGSTDLRGPDGADTAAVLAQPKRLALLAYLAASAPRRFHRRDALLALFWPDRDSGHARAALRRSLYFLRSALGAEALPGRGDDEVAAADDLVWCDATAFADALGRGDLARALDLYRGEFLEGFHVADAPEFQDWLDHERSRLRGLAVETAWRLAADAESLDRLEDAARYARRAAALTPGDAAAERRLADLLERAGERATLLAAPDADPATIAVFPFAVRGDPLLAYLGDGMVDLLGTQLDGAGDLRTVDARALLGQLERERWEQQDLRGALAAARRFGAGRFVLGTIVSAGGRITVTATIYDEAGGAGTAVQAVGDGPAEFFEIVDELARQLLRKLNAGPGARLARLAVITTGSMEALKAYLNGEAMLRAGRYYDAMEALQRAVAADETFALAYYRFAAAAGGCAMHELARQLADLGARHRDRLSTHDRLLFDAQRAWLAGDVAAAETHYYAITNTHPDHVEAWFLLGDLLFHSNPLRGRSAVEARGPFERALELEPDHVASLVHLVRIAALQDRREEALELAARVVAVSPEGDEVLAMRAFHAYASGDSAAAGQVIEALRRARAAAIALAFTDVALYVRDLPAAESLARALTGAARSDEMRALFHVLLGHLRLAQDDPEGALRELRIAEGHDRAWGLETRALFAALPFAGISRREAEAARNDLLGWDPATVAPSGFVVFAMHNGLHAHIRLYLLALLEARLADAAAAGAHAAALEQLAPAPGAEGLSEHLARGARARVLWLEGRIGEALATLEGGRSEAWFLLTEASPFYAQAFERYMRAELLDALGRDDEARGWRESIAERSPYEIIYGVR
jgi:DNA-binding SARP family transcriptional activator